MLLSKNLLKPVLPGTLIAIPPGYYAMTVWLQSVEYRLMLYWWIFAGAALSAVLIALITVSYQVLKPALVNPVKSIHME